MKILIFLLCFPFTVFGVDVVSNCIDKVKRYELVSFYRGLTSSIDDRELIGIWQDIDAEVSQQFAYTILQIHPVELKNGLKMAYAGRSNLIKYVGNDMKVFNEILSTPMCSIGYVNNSHGYVEVVEVR